MEAERTDGGGGEKLDLDHRRDRQGGLFHVKQTPPAICLSGAGLTERSEGRFT